MFSPFVNIFSILCVCVEIRSSVISYLANKQVVVCGTVYEAAMVMSHKAKFAVCSETINNT